MATYNGQQLQGTKFGYPQTIADLSIVRFTKFGQLADNFPRIEEPNVERGHHRAHQNQTGELNRLCTKKGKFAQSFCRLSKAETCSRWKLSPAFLYEKIHWRVARSAHYSTVAANCGYWQFEVDENDQETTGFSGHDGLY